MHELFWKVISKNISHKEYDHVLMFGIWKRNESDERLSRLSFKIRCFIVSRCFWKILEIIAYRIMDYFCHDLRGPGISWDTILNITKIEFELMQDPDRFISFEKGTRVEFLIFVICIMAKPTVSIQNLITKNKKQSILYT